ncbi:MAG: alpha-glucosidase [Frankiales bacterium]|nr:alpha-glucosidase [Frankiales bacterium]
MTDWWRDAVIYQVYLRSFADSNGDGIGDIGGLRARLPYLEALGIDAIWVTPWYPSPMADAGYDVADYRDIDPLFGTLAEAEALIDEAHARGIRLIVDLVPNHCSAAHPWFQAALAADPGSAERELFWFRPGKGADGSEPPNDWPSYFGGSAWTRLPDGDWFLHLFAPEQPDFNWSNPLVRREFADILHFWLDRGVDGFRVDVAHALVKADGLPDVGPDPDPLALPYQDVPGVHEIYREWRQIVDAEDGHRVLVGEVWLPLGHQLSPYLRPDEMHSAFNFDYLCSAWDAAQLRRVIDATIAQHAEVGAPATWVLSNHDVTRQVTRMGRAETSYDPGDRRHGWPTDLELGLRRARAAALVTMALPGGLYLYQGEELGLADVEDLPDAVRTDPFFLRSGGANIGRDGVRVPLPWSGDQPPFGFGPSGTTTWLPQPESWKDLTAEAQAVDPSSVLSLYRSALALRRGVSGDLRWVDTPPGVLAFSRDDGFACWANTSQERVRLPAGTVLLSSSPAPDGWLNPDATVWIHS